MTNTSICLNRKLSQISLTTFLSKRIKSRIEQVRGILKVGNSEKDKQNIMLLSKGSFNSTFVT